MYKERCGGQNRGGAWVALGVCYVHGNMIHTHVTQNLAFFVINEHICFLGFEQSETRSDESACFGAEGEYVILFADHKSIVVAYGDVCDLYGTLGDVCMWPVSALPSLTASSSSV